MAKNRKTRKQKILAAKRHTPDASTSLPTQETLAPERLAYTFSGPQTPTPRLTVPHTSLNTIAHLREDLLRTGIVTAAIIAAEVILFFTLSLQ